MTDAKASSSHAQLARPLSRLTGPCCVLLSCSTVAEVLTAPARDGSPGTSGSAGKVSVPSESGASGASNVRNDVGGTGAGGVPSALGLSLSAGPTHSCVARTGLVYCWGNNRDGQLGVGDTAPHLTPVLTLSSGNVVQVAVGDAHSCWLDADGGVSCFGRNNLGQLGQGDITSSSVPRPVALPGPAASVDVSYGHSCAVLRSGELYCWGENTETQLGQGDAPDQNQPTPVRVGDFANTLQLAAGKGIRWLCWPVGRFTRGGEMWSVKPV